MTFLTVDEIQIRASYLFKPMKRDVAINCEENLL